MRFGSILLGAGIVGLAIAVSVYALHDPKKSGNPSVKAGVAVRGTITNQSESSFIKVPLVLPIPKTMRFAGESVPMHRPEIRERFEKELYLTAHRYYQVVFYLKRTPRYFKTIEHILREEGIPEDFKYLAVIESDLLPTVQSPAGAKGIWQFLRSTAKKHGMRVDRYVDERMNLDLATRGAADYLKKAKERVGNWTLAAAAYNMGVARTQRTIQDQGVDDYYDMYINEETRRYVFRILAAKEILEYPERYGYNVPEWELYQPEPYIEIEVNRGINDLIKWSTQQGITYYDLKRLNPWLVNKRLPRGDYTIRVYNRDGTKNIYSTQ